MRIYFWLGHSLLYQDRTNELMALARDGLRHMENDRETPGIVLMNFLMVLGCWFKGDSDRSSEFADRNLALLPHLPYSEEVSACRVQVAGVCGWLKNVAEARKQYKAIELEAAQHNDLRTQSLALHHCAHNVTIPSGDLLAGIGQLERSLRLAEDGGDALMMGWITFRLAKSWLLYGNLGKAEKLVEKSLTFLTETEDKNALAFAHAVQGRIFLCRGLYLQSMRSLEEALRLVTKLHLAGKRRNIPASLARAHLELGNKKEAVEGFRKAIIFSHELPGETPWSLNAIGGLEAAFEDANAFRRYCREFRREHPDLIPTTCDQWYLEPTAPTPFLFGPFAEDFVGAISPGRRWEDPFNDCSHVVDKGLTIKAPNCRDLWRINRSAPRFLRRVSGSFAAEAVAVSPTSDKPAIGGILLWSDEENYLRIDMGIAGAHEVSFIGCIGNRDRVFGRGSLASERHFLRMERIGNQIGALCSSDGAQWFSVGQVEFPAGEELEVGLHAVGNIDRTVYHGAYQDGTEIRFESFRLWNGQK